MKNNLFLAIPILMFSIFGCTTAQKSRNQMFQTSGDIAVTTIESGKVRGYVANGIYTYKGIPYAKADRFASPEKTTPWEGVRSCMTYGPVAPLLDPVTVWNDEMEFVFDHDWGYSGENCLRANVWTPAINDGKKRPVMFWIHGGGYTAGSSQELPSTHGENLAKKGDVVVVSINHRLNILGYLDLSAYGEHYAESANLSIIDIKAALEWTKANIEQFGGDPNNITIFGQSGGGAKVNALMAMPSAKGLFHKAINQSGNHRSVLLEKEVSQAIGAEVLKELGIEPDEVDKIQYVKFEELAAAGKKAIKTISDKQKAEGKESPGFGGLNWGPSVDGNLFPYQPTSDEAYQLSKDIPLLVGTVKNEFGSMFRGQSSITQEEAIAQIKKKYGTKAEAYLSEVKKIYPNDMKPSDLIDIDFLFRPGAVRQANKKSSIEGGAETFMYLFDWQSPVLDGKYKAMHCMELPFVFNTIDRCYNMTGGTPEAFSLADKVSQAWINFATYGNPNHKGLPDWPAYTSTNTATMHFDNTCTVMPQMDKKLYELVFSK